ERIDVFIAATSPVLLRSQHHSDDDRLSGIDVELHPGARLRAALRRIHRAFFAFDDAAMKRVLHECAARSAVMRRYAAMIRFVLGEERARAARKFEDVGAEVGFVEEA